MIGDFMTGHACPDNYHRWRPPSFDARWLAPPLWIAACAWVGLAGNDTIDRAFLGGAFVTFTLFSIIRRSPWWHIAIDAGLTVILLASALY